MISKQSRITLALLALAAMASLHVSASQVARKAEPLKIGRIVHLTAYYEFNQGGGPKLKVKNYTSYSVPQGTKIFWSITGASSDPSGRASQLEKTGWFILPLTLVPGNPPYVHSDGVPSLHQAKPKAWYVK